MAAWTVVVGSVVVVFMGFETMASLHTLEMREAIEKFLAESPGADLGLGVSGVRRRVIHVATLVASGCATAAAVLGYQALRRNRSARIGLTVVAIPLFLAGLATGAFFSSLVAAASAMLWLSPAREWYAGTWKPSPAGGSATRRPPKLARRHPSPQHPSPHHPRPRHPRPRPAVVPRPAADDRLRRRRSLAAGRTRGCAAGAPTAGADRGLRAHLGLRRPQPADAARDDGAADGRQRPADRGDAPAEPRVRPAGRLRRHDRHGDLCGGRPAGSLVGGRPGVRRVRLRRPPVGASSPSSCAPPARSSCCCSRW